MSIRESTEYKAMTPYNAAGIAEGFVDCESQEQRQAAWQYLHDTGLGYRLQGWFGRCLRDLIESGEVEA